MLNCRVTWKWDKYRRVAPDLEYRRIPGRPGTMHLGDGAVLKLLGVAAAERADVDPMRLAAPTVAVTVLQELERLSVG